jgi:hypothetical protein
LYAYNTASAGFVARGPWYVVAGGGAGAGGFFGWTGAPGGTVGVGAALGVGDGELVSTGSTATRGAIASRWGAATPKVGVVNPGTPGLMLSNAKNAAVNPTPPSVSGRTRLGISGHPPQSRPRLLLWAYANWEVVGS